VRACNGVCVCVCVWYYHSVSRTAAAAEDDIDPVRYGFWIYYIVLNNIIFNISLLLWFMSDEFYRNFRCKSLRAHNITWPRGFSSCFSCVFFRFCFWPGSLLVMPFSRLALSRWSPTVTYRDFTIITCVCVYFFCLCELWFRVPGKVYNIHIAIYTIWRLFRRRENSFFVSRTESRARGT